MTTVRFPDWRMFFPRSREYQARPASAARLREPDARLADFPWTERHLQCLWYDPALRPDALRTSGGEPVEVLDPGVWNLEAGPDFLGASLRIGTGRRITGDVEIHIHPGDWLRHGHANDARYQRVRAHVTYFSGTVARQELPPGCVQIALKSALAAQPLFGFETIDVTAYPYGVRATPAPCCAILAGWRPEEKAHLLEAAGEERLRRKSVRLQGVFREKGQDQALYEEIMVALGYKHNKRPFLRLAEQVPLEILREEAGTDVLTAYALLTGVAGLLPAQAPARGDRETRNFLRGIWDRWWRLRTRWDGTLLPAKSWRLTGLRPANRPERRLMAAAFLFVSDMSLSERWLAWARREPANCLSRAEEALKAPTGTYWDRRLTFGGRMQSKPVSLLGPARARAILNNVFVPFLAALGEQAPFQAGLLNRLPVETDNQVVRQTARSLLGPDYAPSLLRHGLRQQGLIQIFHDYCLNDRSRCADCKFPGFLNSVPRSLSDKRSVLSLL